MSAFILLALGAGALFVLSRKGKTDEAQAIGAELKGLPEETRSFIFRLLLTDDPSFTRETYVNAAVNMQAVGRHRTAVRLMNVADERFPQ
jgi:hypothetical protein